MSEDDLVEAMARAIAEAMAGHSFEILPGNKFFTMARAALAVVREREGWRPIESAPKSGEFLVWHPETGACIIDVSDGSDDFSPAEYGDTHWRPLPAPPGDE